MASGRCREGHPPTTFSPFNIVFTRINGTLTNKCKILLLYQPGPGNGPGWKEGTTRPKLVRVTPVPQSGNHPST